MNVNYDFATFFELFMKFLYFNNFLKDLKIIGAKTLKKIRIFRVWQGMANYFELHNMHVNTQTPSGNKPKLCLCVV